MNAESSKSKIVKIVMRCRVCAEGREQAKLWKECPRCFSTNPRLIEVIKRRKKI